MGVPKFFRWLSERYPLCSQLVQESRIPEFDNLYLDMNGIIHHCTHGNNDDAHFRMSTEQQFSLIFHYIEFLFAKIKPQKLFFMAVDGVAPRAKINQQRSRRFRTAQEAADMLAKAQAKGETLPDEAAFDSNCITPGTEFMAHLSRQLYYFIRKKIAQDDNWKNCRVVLSGHEVPGEGEHKIMEYIRLARSHNDYDPNTRHCLYGLDADLMMLGLVTHDPHFSLLREEVVFGPQRNKKSDITHPESQKFYLMHLSLLREYLDIEFSSLKESLPFSYDIERIIDDFVAITVFIGNDFLPHLPGLHINEGALTVMFQHYKSVLLMSDSYINDGGKINMDLIGKLLVKLAGRERELFEDEYVASEYMSGKSQRGGKRGGKSRPSTAATTITSRQKEIIEQVKVLVHDKYMKRLSLPPNMSSADNTFAIKFASELGLYGALHGEGAHRCVTIARSSAFTEEGGNGDLPLDGEQIDDESEDEESMLAMQRVLKRYDNFVVGDDDEIAARKEKVDAAFRESQIQYYKEKMHLDSEDDKQLGLICGNYLQGLQWVMHYYYNGVQSWGWYYPYHYSPKISDLCVKPREYYERMPPFEMGAPFRPFEQLMGVMPARSKYLLPEAFRELMYDPSSPILDFYPLSFETDLNGKKSDWEAVVKIPFVDEKRLLQAMKSKESGLTPAERKRNQFGNSFVFVYDEKMTPVTVESPLPGIFPDLVNCTVRMDIYDLPVIGNHSKFKKGRLEGVKLGKDALAGFPSLYTLDIVATIAAHGVKVFQQESRNDSVILNVVQPEESRLSALKICQKYLGKRVFVGWPFLVEAQVDGISDALFDYSVDESAKNVGQDEELAASVIKALPHGEGSSEKWLTRSERMKEDYSLRSAVLIGDIEIMFHVSILKGLMRHDNGAMVKEYKRQEYQIDFPYQTVVTNLDYSDLRFKERPPPPIDEEFPINTVGFYLGDGPLYGCEVKVTGYSASGKSLKVSVNDVANLCKKPTFGSTVAKKYMSGESYLPSHVAAKKVGISGFTLSRLAASIYVASSPANEPSMDRINVGLGLKFDGKQLKVPGYTRKTMERGWEYSQNAIALLKDYISQFPSLFSAIEKNKDLYSLEECFPGNDAAGLRAKLGEIKTFLKSKGVNNFDRVPIDVEIMSAPFVREVEKLAIEFAASAEAAIPNEEIHGVPAHVILTPAQAPYRLARYQNFQLGDRVLFVASVGSVDCSSAGTVVGVEKKSTAASASGGGHWIYVVFDKPFLGGSNLSGLCERKCGLIVGNESLLNVTNPQPPLHRRFVPSDFLTPQLNRVIKSAGGEIVSGAKVYEHKAGKRSLLTALNTNSAPRSGKSRSERKTPSEAPTPLDGPESGVQNILTTILNDSKETSRPTTGVSSRDERIAADIKSLLNISGSATAFKPDNVKETTAKKVWSTPPVIFVPEQKETGIAAQPILKTSSPAKKSVPFSKIPFTPTSVLASTFVPASAGASVQKNRKKTPGTTEKNSEASSNLLNLLTARSNTQQVSSKGTQPSLAFQPAKVIETPAASSTAKKGKKQNRK